MAAISLKHTDELGDQYVDLHTHQQTHKSRYLEVLSLFHDETVPERGYYSVGIHPWHADKADLKDMMSTVRSKAAQASFIGESGLDRNCNTPWSRQMSAFEEQAMLSEELKKPLIIHCVKAYQNIIALNKFFRPRQAWVIHGFRANTQIMEELLKHGFYLSVGAYLNKADDLFHEQVAKIPQEKLFIETDEEQVPVESLYKRMSRIRKTDQYSLKNQILKNLQSIIQ